MDKVLKDISRSQSPVDKARKEIHAKALRALLHNKRCERPERIYILYKGRKNFSVSLRPGVFAVKSLQFE